MKKMIALVIVLILCCCLATGIGFGLVGYFEFNNNCMWKGPLATVSEGACASVPSTTNTNTNEDQGLGQTTTLQTYNSERYTFQYPSSFSIDESSDTGRVFVYAENGFDNLNISADDSKIFVSQTNCESLAEDVMDELFYYAAASDSVSVTTIGSAYACKVEFTADYGTEAGRVRQTQYYVESGEVTYVLTITINKDPSNFGALEGVVYSFRLK